MNRSFNFPIAAEQLIPHRAPMRLIDRLLSYDGLQGVVEATFPSDSLYLQDDGSVEPAALVELIAQSFAAVKGYADLQEGTTASRGYLVGVKRFTFQGKAYGGDRLLIYITKTGETDEYALAEGRVERGEGVLAFGNLMVWIPREV
ncbi:MAG: 3-hydroxyacyl-ACP dehydratase [Deltaproteobacteria bacterium]|nr:3-hydroxyacyl-ACP dehydratase [Deltaproteobacteria bacterium]